MGGSYISLRDNGASRQQLVNIYSKIKTHEVVEASEMEYFNRKFPPLIAVLDIEVGDDRNETIIRLNNNGFIVFKGKIKWETIIKNR